MFCIQDVEHHSNQGHHRQSSRILRTFRSHKSLKSAARSQDVMHQRHPSDASSISATRPSIESCRPSTSRAERTVDWDPLRLHPPLATSHLPFTQNNTQSHHQHDLRSARSLHNLSQASSAHAGQPERRPGHTKTVIYEGFDFGFDQTQSSRHLREPMHHYDEILEHYRSPSPSTSSSSGGSDFGPVTPSDVHGPAVEWGDAVTPRPHPAGMGAADLFIKRGGWKRRGIVFAPEEPMAGEDECFDLDMD